MTDWSNQVEADPVGDVLAYKRLLEEQSLVVRRNQRIACERCGLWIDDEEYIVNCGICESCFDERCPCQEGRPKACPLHPWPDIDLSFANG